MRWQEWSYGKPLEPFIEVTKREAGKDALPLTLVGTDQTGSVLGVVGLDVLDDELTDAERAGRVPWILGMVVRHNVRHRGVGRAMLDGIEQAAVGRGHKATWVATGEEAVGFYRHRGWRAVEQLALASTNVATTILTKATSP